MKTLHPAWKNHGKIVIGMLHLPALPGSPHSRRNFDQIRDSLLRDAEALAEGGVHGLMMENFGDVPFYPDRVPAHVIAQMTMLACKVREAIDLPLGINVLRNDGRGALAVAHACGASFIRVNVLCGARVADQGLIQGIAHNLLRERAILGATNVKIFADVDVKHSAALAERPLQDEVDDLIERALADAIVDRGERSRHGKGHRPGEGAFGQERCIRHAGVYWKWNYSRNDRPIFELRRRCHRGHCFEKGGSCNERGGVIAREISDAIVALKTAKKSARLVPVSSNHGAVRHARLQ